MAAMDFLKKFSGPKTVSVDVSRISQQKTLYLNILHKNGQKFENHERTYCTKSPV